MNIIPRFAKLSSCTCAKMQRDNECQSVGCSVRQLGFGTNILCIEGDFPCETHGRCSAAQAVDICHPIPSALSETREFRVDKLRLCMRRQILQQEARVQATGEMRMRCGFKLLRPSSNRPAIQQSQNDKNYYTCGLWQKHPWDDGIANTHLPQLLYLFESVRMRRGGVRLLELIQLGLRCGS